MTNYIIKLNRSVILFGLGLVLLFAISLVMPVKAQRESIRLGISPHTFSLEVPPGSAFSGT